MTEHAEVTIGTGRLTWAGVERRTDRYGAVVLMLDGDALTPSSGYVTPDTTGGLALLGTLFAEVIETRQSMHMGDFFRGLRPETPEVGERIEFGTGFLFSERAWSEGEVEVRGVGVRPEDGRDDDWMNPQALYRAHEQTVRLYFVPAT